jgi:hypothetical protein
MGYTMADVTKKFEGLLKTFVESTNISQDAAEQLSWITIEEFERTGNLSLAQRFLEAMPENYIRRQAYLQWLADFSPLEMDGNVLKKDKRSSARKFDVESAKAIKFWMHKKESKAVSFFSADSVVVAIEQAAGKFNGSRFVPQGRGREIARLAQDMADDFRIKVQALIHEGAASKAETLETIPYVVNTDLPEDHPLAEEAKAATA